MVRMPSSRRTGPTFFIAGWWLGANMKPMPVASIERAICAALRSSGRPSCSSTSALPDLLETLRLPCLLTRAPQAAATNMLQVEMLKVCEPSPPVPTISTRWRLSATSTLVANSRITWAAAVISPMVSFFTRRPTSTAAIITGLISPLMMRRTSESISSWKISRWSMVRARASWVVMGIGRLQAAGVAMNSATAAMVRSMPAASTSRWVTKRRPISPVARMPRDAR